MTRSNTLNALLCACLIQECEFPNLEIYITDEEGEKYTIKTFEEMIDVIDAMDECTLFLQSGTQKAWFDIIMCNDGADQISDYSANPWAEKIMLKTDALSKNMRYEVQTRMINDVWENVWSIERSNGIRRPMTFSSEKAAEDEIDEFFCDLTVEQFLDYSREDYRVRPVFKKGTLTDQSA